MPGGRHLRVLLWAAVLFTFVMAVLPHPPRLPGDPSDKVQHIVAFATLGLLSAFAYPLAPVLMLVVSLALFGGLIELAQAIPVLHRDSSLIDWIADMIASGTVLLIVRWFRRLD